MVLTSWLQVQNQALVKAGSDPITSADLTANLIPEAVKVNLFWDQALEEVLTDHDWAVAKKSILLGTSTTTETPGTPVGVAEISSDTVRKYYMVVPDYDATGLTAGTVNFEIVRVIRNSFVADWVPESNRVYFYQQITSKNVYVDVIFKPGYAAAGRDILFIRALRLKLALLIAKPVTGKDNIRDANLQDEYNKALSEARLRDNTTGDSQAEGNQNWFEAANGTGAGNSDPWVDASGRWHQGS
jgi:hypothetical protein